ncbi:MAG: hypothetical protein A2Z73_02840 [Deltaproteobacteria bacterium RBG_13_60_28]|nr:MAG: hypothetical protein A2Z73_02840 [Deltaproteobacteria bacterium RBG_13_60_28]
MFGISFEQLILLLVLALILFGPEKLPEIAEKIGRWVAKLRQASSEMSQHYQQVLHPHKLRQLPGPHPGRQGLGRREKGGSSHFSDRLLRAGAD